MLLKKLKYWTVASKDANTPVASSTLKNLFHAFSFTKSAKKMAKTGKNSKLIRPSERAGDPNMLNLMSCENTVDTMSIAKSPKSANRGKKTGFSRLGIATEPSFL